MRYKVGNRVRIKSLDWYNENKASDDEIWCSPYWFGKEHSKWCGKVMTISHVRANHYTMKEDGHFDWTDEMIEGLVEEEKPLCEGCCSLELKYNKLTIADNICTDKVEIILQDYELEKEGDKWFAVKRKKEYPKTYEECCEIMNVIMETEIVADAYSERLDDYELNLDTKIENLRKLLICRDAYWKIAGKEMGLGKPWEPDWEVETSKYIILCKGREIQRHITCKHSRVLAFPTKEMRDAFYENFKELINECKELL